uniref:Putative beta-neurotoxin RjAa2f n=1 Tax=Rhopalurus junceus TaxID=419285 RepID=SCX2F_RHOJU|nr:RecName: Full=Putative beta-neurotoxin RjAa2f; Flags: Precursor [Rhopalurus junceus]ADV16833.1 venom toxin [Rhopalurus junceus]ADV16834.1 venom toxin [Rhopalurus junceus]
MKILIFIIASFMLIGVECKEGYPMGSDGCKISCVVNNEYCKGQCSYISTQEDKKWKGSDGYCYFWGLACYCTGLPENAKVWDSKTNKCGG